MTPVVAGGVAGRQAYSGQAADMWALGATLFTLVVGHPPFLARNEMELVEMLKSAPLNIPQHLDPHLR